MVRMKEEILQKTAETKKQGGFRKPGRPQLRWEDCLKRHLRNAGGKNNVGLTSTIERGIEITAQ